MTCKCGETGMYNEIMGLGFYYCRNCKIEIKLEEEWPPLMKNGKIVTPGEFAETMEQIRKLMGVSSVTFYADPDRARRIKNRLMRGSK